MAEVVKQTPPPAADQEWLGRLVAIDPRDKNYALPRVKTDKVYRYWNLPVVLDQGPTPRCVAFSTTGWLIAGPVANRDMQKDIERFADQLYRDAQDNDEWPGTCVDMETECLSRRGWLRGDQLMPGDQILTANLQTRRSEWAEVEKVHRHTMPYRVHSVGGLAIAATDNHRWVVHNRIWPDLRHQLVPTTDLRTQHSLPRCYPPGCLPEAPIYDDSFVELVAWVCTEGYYRPDTRKGWGIVVSQKTHKKRVAAVMEANGVAPGFEKTDGAHSWELSGEVALKVREAAPGRAPTIDFLSALTLDQLHLFIDACIAGDGHVRLDKTGRRKSSISFAQKTGPILDSFLAACALAGFPVSRVSQFGGSGMDVESWHLRHSSWTDVKRITASPYIVGPVWCPQSRNGTFFARRGGSIFVTGNSYEGTSVRGAYKVLKQRGFVSEYNWATDAETCARWILERGPVVVGTDWLENMNEPDSENFIHAEGPSLGGHAWLLIGFNRMKDCPDGSRAAFRLQNSWGADAWGDKGRAWISLPDMDKLIKADGEAATAPEIDLDAVRRALVEDKI